MRWAHHEGSGARLGKCDMPRIACSMANNAGRRNQSLALDAAGLCNYLVPVAALAPWLASGKQSNKCIG